MHALALQSSDAMASIPAEACCLLAPMLLLKPQPDGTLRACIKDVYDPTMGHIVSDLLFSGAAKTGLAYASER